MGERSAAIESRLRLEAARDWLNHVLDGDVALEDVAPAIVRLVGRALEFEHETA